MVSTQKMPSPLRTKISVGVGLYALYGLCTGCSNSCILSSQVDLGATFGIYHPDEDSYTLIEQFTNVAGVPEELIPLANGRAVYFQSGEEFFKIILEQL